MRKIVDKTASAGVFGLWLLLTCGLLFSRQTLQVEVSLVNIVVTVLDENGRLVTDLDREDFRVYEDDVLQDIGIFEKRENVNSSVGMLLDSSGSMVDVLPMMKTGVRDFTRSMPQLDEFFVLSFGTNVRLLHTATQGQKHLEEATATLRGYGTSVLYDGLLYGMGRIARSERERKALIVLTDGHDNGSVAGHGDVVQEAQRSAVLLYFIAIGSKILVDTHSLESLAGLTGGRVLYLSKQEPITPAIEQIRSELGKQYYLGYQTMRRPGFHRIRVEIPARKLKARAKTGYLG